MSRRFSINTLVVVTLIGALIFWFSIDAGSVLWSILSGIIMIAAFVGYFLCSRCPHCGRIIRLDYLNKSHIYCRHCGGKVGLGEDILHPEE